MRTDKPRSLLSTIPARTFLVCFLVAIIFLPYNFVKASLVSNFVANVSWNLRASEGEKRLAEIATKLNEEMDAISRLKETIEIREKLKVVEDNLKEAEKVRKEIVEEGNRLAESYKQLEIETKRLEDRQEELKRREQVYATGFYTSLGAIALGIIGTLLRLPTITLERRHKTLEIEHLELTIAQERKRMHQFRGGVSK